MKLKLDENLGQRQLRLFQDAGYDAESVFSEGLSGSADHALYQICVAEQRALITLDLDFADPRRFPSEHCGGIAILRCSPGPSATALNRLCQQLITILASTPLAGELWIVEVGRIRVHQREE